jgi:hypothetical protein
MGKWITEFSPNKSGSYLITTKPVTYPINYMKRWEYDCNTNLWRNGFISTKFMSNYAWWDEYGITENKIKKKIKF